MNHISRKLLNKKLPLPKEKEIWKPLECPACEEWLCWPGSPGSHEIVLTVWFMVQAGAIKHQLHLRSDWKLRSSSQPMNHVYRTKPQQKPCMLRLGWASLLASLTHHCWEKSALSTTHWERTNGSITLATSRNQLHAPLPLADFTSVFLHSNKPYCEYKSFWWILLPNQRAALGIPEPAARSAGSPGESNTVETIKTKCNIQTLVRS